MKILYVSQVFPPDPGPSLRALEQAACLKRLGHEVTVITSMAYYPSGQTHPDYRGRFYLEEDLNGVRVKRIWSLPCGNRGIIKRVASQLSFAVHAFLVGLTTRPDLVIASTHIFAVEVAVIVLAWVKRAKSIIEFRDMIPECLALTGVGPRSVRATFLLRYFNVCFRLADIVAIPTGNMIPGLLKRGVAREKIVLLPHAADRKRFTVRKPQLQSLTANRFNVVYAGSFSTYYDVPNIVRAARVLHATNQRDCDKQVHFVLIGDGQDSGQVKTLCKRHAITNVTLTGHVSPAEIPGYLADADLCITSLVGEETPDFYHNYPTTKICEYLMAGKPLLAVENTPVMGDFIERIGAGHRVPANDPRALAHAIMEFRSCPDQVQSCAENARAYATEHMDRMAIVTTFERSLRQKLANSRQLADTASSRR